MSMYHCDTPCPSNEELALRIQGGDPQAAPLLLSQNEGYLTMLATSYCEQFSQDFLVDDLKQEGALALLDAATRFDFSYGTKLLTYATPAIETAMRDCAAQGSFSLSLPLDRYRQLRQVAFLYATHEWDIETDLLPAIQEKLTVSAKVARRLLEEYRTVFQVECLGEGVFDLGYGGDPARAYDRFMRRTLILQRIGGSAEPQRAEFGALLSGNRPAQRSGHDLSGAGHPAQLQRPQRRGESIQKRHPETEKAVERRHLRSVALHPESHSQGQSGGRS